jgi:hypothetical protein
MIGRAYEVFSDFPRPEYCMPASLYESEREEFEAMLEGKTRENLRAVDLGSSTWSPLALLTPEAIGHFMPRLIDFALSGELDFHSDPFFERFINMSLCGPSTETFSLFKTAHRTIVYECLVCLRQDFSSQVEDSCISDELQVAIGLWNPSVNAQAPSNEA